MSLTYKDSGVDIERGDALVERIKSKVKSTYGKRVVGGVGGFACLYEVGDRYLAAGTDGVGTKLKLAFDCDQHDTVGIDLVAMCVNDIICTGATPLFFMDYLATGKLELGVSEAIIDGIVEGCLQSGAALIGGETAEMPGMYSEGEYDLAGFAVGEVKKENLLGGKRVKAGDTLIGLSSDGFHSNGYSLVRKVIEKAESENSMSGFTKTDFLKPTRIYWNLLKGLIEKGLLSGCSHITGGGLLNIQRMNEDLGYEILMSENQYRETFFTEEFKWVQERGVIATKEMLKTFNCGIGMVLATSSPDLVKEHLDGLNEKVHILGKVTNEKGLFLDGEEFSAL